MFGNFRLGEVEVSALVQEYIGMGAYMRLDALNRLMRDGHVISGAHLTIDTAQSDVVYGAVKRIPRVAGVAVQTAMLETFRATMAETLEISSTFNIAFAVIIAFGVIYNNARISLSERGRELASLRVLGFTQSEIAYIMMGELFILMCLALPIGSALGYGLA